MFTDLKTGGTMDWLYSSSVAKEIARDGTLTEDIRMTLIETYGLFRGVKLNRFVITSFIHEVKD